MFVAAVIFPMLFFAQRSWPSHPRCAGAAVQRLSGVEIRAVSTGADGATGTAIPPGQRQSDGERCSRARICHTHALMTVFFVIFVYFFMGGAVAIGARITEHQSGHGGHRLPERVPDDGRICSASEIAAGRCDGGRVVCARDAG